MNPVFIAVAIPAVALAGLGVLIWLGAEERSGFEVELASVRALSEADAERLAIDLLTRPGLFQTRAASAAFTSQEVPSHVRSLLSRFEEIVRGEFWVGVAALEQRARLPGFLKIGEDSELTQILVRPGDSRIHVSYGEGPRSVSTVETAPTIWHQIIVVSGVNPPRA